MPDNEPPSSSPSFEPRHLPVVVPPARENGGNWFTRTLRRMFGWRGASIRSDLKDVLEAMSPGESGFSLEESRMLRNILGLRERRIGDVMVPRADIVAVQQNIALGELMRTFKDAGHSRLVVYDDTLDDPVGMVHIRDLIAFMTERATVEPEKNAKRKKPLPAGLDLRAINLAMPLSAAKIMRPILFVPPSMRAMDLLARMQATRMHLALVIDEYGGTDGVVSIEDIVEEIVGEIADEHDEDETAGGGTTAGRVLHRRRTRQSGGRCRASSAATSTSATRRRKSTPSAATWWHAPGGCRCAASSSPGRGC